MTKVKMVIELNLDDVDDELTQARVIASINKSTGFSFFNSVGDLIIVDLDSATLMEFEKS